MNNNSLGRKAFKGASWLALFKFTSQGFSWVVTIIVARLLVPDDYGLMAMATIITGYAEIFCELGLGAAIVQKPKVTQRELSSVFWFSFFFAFILALSCFPVAKLTAFIMNEPRVIPLTQAVSLIFLLSGLAIVPINLLKKDMEFKALGRIEMVSTIVSCVAMVPLAYIGAGVWTLIGGRLIQLFTRVPLLYKKVNWFPNLYFNLHETKSYLKFGVTFAFGRSLFYLWEQSDKFFAGRLWNAHILGYYTLALQLAQVPTEKIVVLINQVSFPALSKLQNDKQAFDNFYLNTTKITAITVLPLFVGGYLVGEDLVKVLLNEKWYTMIFVFKFLCLSQIMMALNAINNFAHAAQGRPHWGLCYHIAGIILMPVSFYLAVPYGLHAILIPWFTTFILITLAWIIITTNKIGIPLSRYILNLANPVIATLIMSTAVLLIDNSINHLLTENINSCFRLSIKIGTGALFYIVSLGILDRRLFSDLKELVKSPA
jgi:teichuronic acid exporter